MIFFRCPANRHGSARLAAIRSAPCGSARFVLPEAPELQAGTAPRRIRNNIRLGRSTAFGSGSMGRLREGLPQAPSGRLEIAHHYTDRAPQATRRQPAATGSATRPSSCSSAA